MTKVNSFQVCKVGSTHKTVSKIQNRDLRINLWDHFIRLKKNPLTRIIIA